MSEQNQDPSDGGRVAVDSVPSDLTMDQLVDIAVAETPAPKKTRSRAKAAVIEEAPVESVAVVVPSNGSGGDEPAPKKTRKRKTAEEPVVEAKSIVEIAESAAEPAVVEEPAVIVDDAKTFQKLGLSAELLKSVTAVGYEEPTPIQEMVIPVLLEGRDIIAQAQTGSGKTAAFGLPIIETINPRDRFVQALVLAPTRELAIQVAEALHKYGRHKEVETLPIYGGQPYERQFRGLQRGPQIVVGTPGRVMDHMRRETLNLDHLKFFVLDEADEMLDMGFVEDIEWILQQVPESRQTALFSATMPPRIADLAATHLKNPSRLTVPGKQMTVPETHQVFYEVPRARKTDALTRILDAETPPLSMIFARTKLGVDELGEALLARGYQVETLHGDLSQAQRDRVMRRFRTGQADILIATDVAARGLDIPNVTHVINFDIPESSEAYVHRIGRTGRAGKKGEAITLVTPRETRWLRQIERVTKAKIEGRRLPTAADVAERRLEVLKQQVLEVMNDESALAYYNAVVDDLAEEHDATQVAAALLKLYADETGRGAPAEPQADDIALVAQPMPQRQDRFESRPRDDRGPRRDGDNVRLFVNIGRNLGVRPQDIVGAIANEAGIPGRSIGAIDIFDGYSFVEVPASMADRVIDALVRSGIKGRPVNAEIARPDAAPRQDRAPRREFDRSGPDRGFDRGPRRDSGGYAGNRYDRDGNQRQPDRSPSGNRWEETPRRYESNDRGPRDDRYGRGPRRDY
jgi:ATP-dependent RNA helicase DeaD